MKVVQWPFPLLALAAIAGSVVLVIWIGCEVHEASVIIQAGASVALAFLTWGYLQATELTAREAGEQTEASRAILKGSEKARIDAIRPFLCLRYTIDRSKPNQKVLTWLVNVGRGPAYDITLFWNLVEAVSISGDVIITGHLMQTARLSALNNTAFGFPLGVDNNSPEMRICFFSADVGSAMPSPLHVKNLYAIIVCSDMEGRRYSTYLKHGVQFPKVGEPTMYDLTSS